MHIRMFWAQEDEAYGHGGRMYFGAWKITCQPRFPPNHLLELLVFVLRCRYTYQNETGQNYLHSIS